MFVWLRRRHHLLTRLFFGNFIRSIRVIWSLLSVALFNKILDKLSYDFCLLMSSLFVYFVGFERFALDPKIAGFLIEFLGVIEMHLSTFTLSLNRSKKNWQIIGLGQKIRKLSNYLFFINFFCSRLVLVFVSCRVFF